MTAVEGSIYRWRDARGRGALERKEFTPIASVAKNVYRLPELIIDTRHVLRPSSEKGSRSSRASDISRPKLNRNVGIAQERGGLGRITYKGQETYRCKVCGLASVDTRAAY